MTIKLMILKSGEELISDINEMAVGEEDDQKVIGYFLRRTVFGQDEKSWSH